MSHSPKSQKLFVGSQYNSLESSMHLDDMSFTMNSTNSIFAQKRPFKRRRIEIEYTFSEFSSLSTLRCAIVSREVLHASILNNKLSGKLAFIQTFTSQSTISELKNAGNFDFIILGRLRGYEKKQVESLNVPIIAFPNPVNTKSTEALLQQINVFFRPYSEY